MLKEKTISSRIFTLLLSASLFTAFAKETSQINWLAFNDIYPCAKKGEKKKLQKKIIIDFHTDWCGWCKVLERQTLNDPQVLTYLNKHFHMVKFNPEKDIEPICYKDFSNRYDADGKEVTPFYLLENSSYNYMQRGEIHSFAVFLMQNELTYPTMVVLDESGDTFLKIKGYKEPQEFLNILKSVVDYDATKNAIPNIEEGKTDTK